MIEISSTKLGTFMECPRKAELTQEGWTEISPPSYLTFGELGHAVMAVLCDMPSFKKSAPSRSVITRIVEKVAMPGPENQVAAGLKGQDREIMLGEIIEVLVGYMDRRWEDEKDWISIQTEKMFCVDYGRSTVLKGKPDRVVKLSDGTSWLLERKFKGRIDEDYLTYMLPMDLQSHFYVKALHLQGIQLKGVIYDVVRQPQISPRKGERVADYLKRLGEDIASRRDFYFCRLEMELGSASAAKTFDNINLFINKYERWVAGKDPTYENSMNCRNRGMSCQFLKVCSVGDYTGLKKKPIR